MTSENEVGGIEPADQAESALRARLSRQDIGIEENRFLSKAIALLRPSESVRWAALAGCWPERSGQLLLRALILGPGDFRLYINTSNLHLQTGKGREAALAIRRAILLKPDFARAYVNLAALMVRKTERWKFQSRAWCIGSLPEMGAGNIERQIADGKVLEPLENVEKVLESLALSSEAWRLRGILRQRLFDIMDSRRSFCRSLICDPAAFNGYLAAASHFIEQRDFSRATRLLDFAEILAPEALAVITNRAAILERTGRLLEALQIAKRLTILQPTLGERYFMCGTVLHDMDNARDALINLRRAVVADPLDRRFQNNFAIMLLKFGRYSEGFSVYEGRWFAPSEAPSSERSLWPRASFDLPLWEPNLSKGGNVLLWGEQGIGDEIWGLSYLTALASRPEHFTVETDARLVPLVRRCFPDITTIPRRTEIAVDVSPYQAQLPLLSLPHRLCMAERQTPSGWMRPSADAVSAVKRHLSNGRPTRIVGLAWRSTKPLQHRSFAIDIDRFAILKQIENTLFLPLQYGMREHEWDALFRIFGEDRIVHPGFDVRNDLLSLADAVAACDVVVTLATALVPMAVATGTRSVTILRPVQRDWRYRVGARHSAILPHAALLWPPESDDPAALRRAVSATLA